MRRYNPSEIEPKWQEIWEETDVYKASDTSEKPKYYAMSFFPYPSGVGLHIGHTRNFAITDAVARYKRMQGYEVLHPMGWDSFGLPAENYAIKTGTPPQQTTKENTDNFRRQSKRLGLSIDWSREFASSDPEYYKWTQWFFLLLHERGLAYRKESLQFWCDKCKTVLANEQVVNGCCWRHDDTAVTKKMLPQWFFKITEYADRLEKDLEKIDWPEGIKAMQRNWIGHKTGINITYKVSNAKNEQITCFTTRPDTNFGATFVVLAPEHEFVQRAMHNEITPDGGVSHWEAIKHYVDKAMAKSELERQEEGRLKTGVFTGFYVKNELNGKLLPVWVSDFVLAGFGTGAVVGVPGHDLRDFEFAKQFNLPIERVVAGPDGDNSPITEAAQVQEKAGTMVNSDFLNGLSITDATEKIQDYMETHGIGKRVHMYHLRDWLISRQRYWGAPIPMVHCDKDGIVPVPAKDLPVKLPHLTNFAPSEDGRAPLARAEEWVNTTCPTCGGPATRESDTMDGFACSSWYFLRFADPHNDQAAFEKTLAEHWLPVDMYVGGAEHAVMHLLYARMWTKVMNDAGLINFDEPFARLRNQGMLLAADGTKFSKSKGNDIKPEAIIDSGYGADALRVIIMFLAPYDQSTPWSEGGLAGVHRFLNRAWALVQEYLAAGAVEGKGNAAELATQLATLRHKTVKKVTADYERMGFNTAIAALMEYVNGMFKLKAELPFAASKEVWHDALSALAQMLAPFAPHFAEEVWHDLGYEGSIHLSPWPTWDEAAIVEETVTIVVQVNGKVRANIAMPKGTVQAEVVTAAKQDEKIASMVTGDPKRVIFVPDKLVNFVI